MSRIILFKLQWRCYICDSWQDLPNKVYVQQNALYCLTYCVVGGLHSLCCLWIFLGLLNKILNVEIV